MIIDSLHVLGFGRLVERRFEFTAGLNVVYGANECGKSTLANAIVATLYGAERKKDVWRPWTGERFATALTYRLADGSPIEIQRDFDRDGKGLRIYDRAGNEISAKLGGHKVVPGEAHLGIPLDVFLNAACMKQQAIAIGEGRDTGSTATHLARALDGGPRDDAALGAIERLDNALRAHVGTERARKNAPLRSLRAAADAQRAERDAARARLSALEALRDRQERAAADRDRLTTAAGEIERRTRALRAGSIAKRLANLREFRSELAELGAAYAAYTDVAGFRSGCERDADAAFHQWESAQAAAANADADAASQQLDDADRAALERRRRDAGAIGEAAFASLRAAEERAGVARAALAAAGASAPAQPPTDGRAANALLAGAVAVLCIAIAFAVAHNWTWTGAAGLAALAGFLVLLERGRVAAARTRTARERYASARRELQVCESEIAAILEPLGIDGVGDLSAHRAELRTLAEREARAHAAAERARAARAVASAAAARFDALADAAVPGTRGDRAARNAAIQRAAARRSERDGIAAHLHALEMRRSTILGGEDELALETELAELQRDGVDAADEGPAVMRALDAEANAAAERLRAARETFARTSGEIAALTAGIPDLAELDERLLRTQSEIERLEAFERAVSLARTTIDVRTQEAHAAFARRLEHYAAGTLGEITAGRYATLFVDPATLAIRVRIPETQAIEDLGALSAGTRDQAYLVVRLAMARVFAEGLETPPLLLDDPFAYWDWSRIERCLPILERAAGEGQALLFTSSAALAAAACARGAHRIDLSEPPPTPEFGFAEFSEPVRGR